MILRNFRHYSLSLACGISCITLVIFFSLALNNCRLSSGEFSLRFSPSYKIAEAFSFGQRALVADLFFLRALIHFGEVYDRPEEKDAEWLYANLDVVTWLDPGFRSAYFYGGVIFASTEEEVKRANIFLLEAIKRAPREWRIPFWIGCNYYYEIKDYQAAIEYFRRAAGLPLSPPYIEAILAMLYYKASHPQTALAILQELKKSATNRREEVLLEKKIAWLSNIIELESRLAEFKEKFQRPPLSLEELVSKGVLNKIPEDPFGGGYFLEPDSGRVKSITFSKPKKIVMPEHKHEAGVCDLENPGLH